MDTTRKPLATLARTALHGRPTPPAPPRGPISRVSSNLGMRRPAASPVDNNGFPRIPFGLPNLRRNVCPHFYMTGPRGPIPITAPHLLKALMRQDINTARCQLRGGVHLEQGYVSDICLSPRFNQCVFYEDDLNPELLIDNDSDGAYREILTRLQSRGRFGMRLGLARTRVLLRALGNPHRSLQGVLIGGTNGKGSTQALVGAALIEAGYRVGQTPKPHLVSYRERIQVEGHPISVADFSALLTDVLDIDDRLFAKHGPSTEFEVLTSAAFLYFSRMKVDVGVIEVGIGGRLDATNVWQGGVSAIINVALDHMEVLGPTIVDIATEKAQIIKRGDSAAVTGAVEPGLGVIARRAARVNVPLIVVEPLSIVRVDRQGTRVRAPGGEELTIGLLGQHQAANAAVAWHVLDALSDAGIATVSSEQRSAAFATARWPGRMELISRAGQPTVLLDGAHNPHGVAALAESLQALLPQISGGGAVTVLIGVLANHWQPGMLDPLMAVLPAATIFATGVPESSTALPPDRLAFEWGGAGVRAIANPQTALDAALQNARNVGGLLLVCGSLYLVGYVRGELLGSNQPAQ